jgi:hypothetical protein
MIDWFESGDRSYFILSAIFGGLAASTKLNAAFIPVILGVCYVFHSVFVRHNSIAKVINQFILYGLISFLIVLPWYLKAWYQTGNPFWPFLWNILGGKNWDELGSQYFFNFIKSPNLPLSVKNWIQALWVLTAHPSSYGSAGFELNWLYLSLLPFSILALFFYKTKYRQVFIWLGIIALALYTLWFLQTHQIRFLMPVIGIFSLLIAIGITWFIELKNWKWNLLWSLIFILYLLSASWIMKPSYRDQILDNRAYLTGKISRNQYLEQHNQGYKVFEYANANLPPDALIWLALYEVRGYYLDRDYLWANPISQRVIPLEQFQDADQLVGELSELGISYILLQTSTIDTYSDIEYGTHYSNLIRSLVEQHGQLEYSDTQEELYKLTP